MILGNRIYHFIRLMALLIYLVYITSIGYTESTSRNVHPNLRRVISNTIWMYYGRVVEPHGTCKDTEVPGDVLHYLKQASVDNIGDAVVKDGLGTARNTATEGDTVRPKIDLSSLKVDKQIPVDNSKNFAGVGAPSTPDLPPLDSATVDDKHHLLPTFNEYHAMRFEQGQKQVAIGDDTTVQSPTGHHPQQQPFQGGAHQASSQQIHSGVDRQLPDNPVSLNHPVPKSSTGGSPEGIKGSLDPHLSSSNEKGLPAHGDSEPAALGDGASSTLSESELGPTVASTTPINDNDSPIASLSDAKKRASVKDANELPMVGSHLDSASHNTGYVSNSGVPSHEVDMTGMKGDGDSTNVSPGQVTLLRRNVAALACGAKLLDSSRAIKSPGAVLNSNKDDYLNVACSADKWFIVEVCEPVQLRVIELANYELFSSRVKTFKVYTSDRYPVKTWDLVGHFTAQDVKGLQTFAAAGEKLIKYVKFEMVEHYGSQHYCPLTMIRLFGRVSDDLADDDDDDEEEAAAEEKGAGRQGDGAGGILDTVPPSATPNGVQGSGTSEIVREGSGGGSTDAEVNTNLADESTQSVGLEGSGSPPRVECHLTDGCAAKDSVDEVGGRAHDEVLSADHHLTTDPVASSTVDSQGHPVGLGELRESPLQTPDSPVRQSTSPSWRDAHSSDEVLKDAVGHPEEQDVKAGERQPPADSAPADKPSIDRSSFPSDSAGVDKVTLETGESSQSPSHRSPSRNPQSPRGSPVSSDGVHRHPVQADGVVVGSRNANRSPVRSQLELANRLDVDKRGVLSYLADSVYQFLVEPIKSLFISTASSIGKDVSHPLAGVYDLARCQPSPHHHHVITVLLSYQLIRDWSDPLAQSPVTSDRLPLIPQVIQGLRHLDACFWQLPTAVHNSPDGRIFLRLASGNQTCLTVLQECQSASSLLGIPFVSWSADRVEASILHLFMAHREYRPTGTSCNRFPVWSRLDGRLLPVCPALPDFLLPRKVTGSHTEGSLPKGGSESGQSVDRRGPGVSTSQPPQSSSTVRHGTVSSTRTRAGQVTVLDSSENVVVVPASLSGSRKDAVWMRLSNRVRLLERNVSVSMGYLEELSQSYRRQMERLVRSFNLTTAWLKVTAQTAEARDQQQQARLDALERRLENLLTEVKTALKLPNGTSIASDSYHRTTSLPPSTVGLTEKSTSGSSTSPASFEWSLPPPVPWFRSQETSTSSPSQPFPGASPSNHTAGWWGEGPDEDWLVATGDQYDDEVGEEEDGVVEVEQHSSPDLDDVDPHAAGEEVVSHGVALKSCPPAHRLHHHPPPVFCLHHHPLSPAAYCAGDSGHEGRGCASRSWWACWVRWFTTTTTSSSSSDSQRWHFSIGSMVGMAVLHVAFALFSHLLIYYLWLRPTVLRHTFLANTSGKSDVTLSRLDGQAVRFSSSSPAFCRALMLDKVSSSSEGYDQTLTGRILSPDSPSEPILGVLSVSPVHASNYVDRKAPVMASTPDHSLRQLANPLTDELSDRILVESPEALPKVDLVVSEDQVANDKIPGGFEDVLLADNVGPWQRSEARDQLKTETTSSVSSGTTPSPSASEIKLVNGYPASNDSTSHFSSDKHQFCFEKTSARQDDCQPYCQPASQPPAAGEHEVTGSRSDFGPGVHRRRKKWRWKQPRPPV